MPFKIHLGEGPAPPGYVHLKMANAAGLAVELYQPSIGTCLLKIRPDGPNVVFVALPDTRAVPPIPLDENGSVRCSGVSGPWSFGHNGYSYYYPLLESDSDKARKFIKQLKENLCPL